MITWRGEAVSPSPSAAPRFPGPAQTQADALRDLARRLSAALPRETLTLSAASEDARRAVESELRALGVRTADTGGIPVRITLSENLREHLAIAEAARGEEPLVLMTAWPREPARGAPPSALSLDKKLIWEQDAPMLDFSAQDNLLLVLEPTRVAVYDRRENSWQPRLALPIPPASFPRDLRGRLIAQRDTFQAYLPGMTCRGVLEPAPTLDCKPGETVWPLYSGATLAARATFRPGRNFFEGPVTAVSGARLNLPPFYSAAPAPAGWVVATLDGRAAIFDAVFSPAGMLPTSGDVAGTEAKCGAGRQVLQETGGAVQLFEIAGSVPAAVGAPVEFPAPVIALWPAGAATASAITRDTKTGKYAAYSLSVACGG